MNFARFILARLAAVAIIAACAAGLSQFAVAQDKNPLAGTWKYQADKSSYMGGPARFKDANLSFATSGDPVMTIEGTDPSGKPVKATFASVPDGKPHPISGLPAFDTGTWSKYNDNVTTYQYNRGKNIAVVGVRALSADGSTLTFQEKTYDNNGKQTGTAVMVFVNPDVKVASASKPAAPEPPKPEAPKPVFNPQEQAALDALSKNDNDEAIRLYTAMFDANMQTPMLYFDHTSRGIAYLRKGQPDQALADFDAAVKLKPEDGDARFRRGAIKFERMQYEDAVADLTAAITANPMNADAYNMRSFAFFRLMKNAEGGADGEKACELKKDYCNN